MNFINIAVAILIASLIPFVIGIIQDAKDAMRKLNDSMNKDKKRTRSNHSE